MDKLQKPKARLRHASPLVYWICWGFVYTNILIGYGLYYTSPKAALVVVRGPLTLHAWAIIFCTLGILGAISLIVNVWHATRGVLMIGLVIKALWFYALLVTAQKASMTAIGVWGMLAFTQFLVVIFFPEEDRWRS